MAASLDPTKTSHVSDDERAHEAGEETHAPLEEMSSIEAEYGSFDGMTLYEKKCTIVNRAIDEMGLGRYQWCIFALCGMLTVLFTRRCRR